GGDAVKFYLDGVLQTANRSLSAATNTNNFGNNPIYIFSRAGTTEFTSGTIDDLRVYDSALTGQQIQQIYNSVVLGSAAVTSVNTSIVAGAQQQVTAAGKNLGTGGSSWGTKQADTDTQTLSASGWQQGFDFRNTSTFVTDPSGDTYVLNTTAYPTKGNGVTYGWVNTRPVSARDRNAKLDPRLAGINFVYNGTPATFYVDLPSPGTYNVSLAMGDAGNGQCWVQCQVQFLDGSTVLATVTGGVTNLGYFYD